jgi:putative nucleotidyltransferase with HDIG domain
MIAMSFFGTRRTRQARVFRPNPTVWDRFLSAFRDHRILTHVLLGAAATLGLVIAQQSWKSPFPYRVGQVLETGVQARVEFQVENKRETEKLLEEALEAAPLVLIQEPTVIDRLQSQLRSQLSEIANADTMKSVATPTLAAFGLTMGDQTSRETSFSLLKNQLRDADESKGKRIDELMQEFDLLIKDARNLGLIDHATARRLLGNEDDVLTPSNRTRSIKVIDSSGAVLHNGVLADILLQEQLKETGRLGKSWPALSKLYAIQSAVEQWLQLNLRNQLRLDAVATEQELKKAGELAQQKFDRYLAGATIIPAGTQLTDSDSLLELLRIESGEFDNRATATERMTRVLGSAMLIVLLIFLFGSFLRYAAPEMLEDTPKLVIFVGMVSVTVFLGCLMSRDPWRAEILPLLAAVMITAIAYSQSVAVVTAFCLSLLISISTVSNIGHFISLMTICVTSIIPLGRIKSRLVMIKVGFLVAAVAFYAAWGVGVMQANGTESSWRNIGLIVMALKFSGWALVCCYLVAGSLPFIEHAFGIVTDISLLELTGVSHPLLQELARRAPGTYNHSMTVASLAETAAESIGANGLLARVGAYFHDIGKMTKPEYFIENLTEGSENQHKSLAPAMSTLIIIGHVKDGLELAEEHNLPEPLRHFIEQHHGTTLVEYFYREATKKADEDHRTDADESSFRYPGPKPQSRETAVLMLADAVESASRTLKEPTPKRIQSLVHEITLKRLLDGQFDECNLKMNEINMVEESLIKSLLAAHHGRVRYPGQKTA